MSPVFSYQDPVMRKKRNTVSLPAALVAAGVAIGCAHAHAATMRITSAVVASQAVGFDVILPLRDPAGLEALVKAQHDSSSPLFHQWITPQQFAQRFGPSAATMSAVAAGFAAQGLGVETHSRSLHVTGSAAVVSRALGTSLMMGATPDGRSRMVAARAPTLPQAAMQAGAVVLDFANQVHSFHSFAHRVNGVAIPFGSVSNRRSTTGGYWFTDLKQAYEYPSYQTKIKVGGKSTRLDGTGTTIGILMSSDMLDSDVQALFDHEKFSENAGIAAPKLYQRVYVNGGTTVAGGIANGALDEASLDVQESLTGAPGAHVILYDIPDLTDQSIIAGYLTIDEANAADVVSSSFGGCELSYLPAYNSGTDYTYLLKIEHELYVQGNAQGISFLASSGDEAGLECPTSNYGPGVNGTFIPSVSTPAADTNVTAVGGTNVITVHDTKTLNSALVSENAWSDPEIPYDIYGFGATVSGGSWGAGGGLSTLFAKPSYQALSVTGSDTQRALPDIGMQVGGCPGGIAVLPCNGGDQAINGNGNTDRSYVYVAVQGKFLGLIGTSVSSPELAGATALLVEQYGRMGNLNQYIYDSSAIQTLEGGKPNQPTTMFHRGIPGYNGVVANGTMGRLYNYTTGVGTPSVYHYVGAANAQTAGLPETPSNP